MQRITKHTLFQSILSHHIPVNYIFSILLWNLNRRSLAIPSYLSYTVLTNEQMEKKKEKKK